MSWASGHGHLASRVGAPCRTRTCDLLVRSQTLYPTELRALRGAASTRPLSGRRAVHETTILPDGFRRCNQAAELAELKFGPTSVLSLGQQPGNRDWQPARRPDLTREHPHGRRLGQIAEVVGQQHRGHIVRLMRRRTGFPKKHATTGRDGLACRAERVDTGCTSSGARSIRPLPDAARTKIRRDDRVEPRRHGRAPDRAPPPSCDPTARSPSRSASAP